MSGRDVRSLKAAVLASWAKANVLERCREVRLLQGIALLAWFTRRERTVEYRYQKRLRILPDAMAAWRALAEWRLDAGPTEATPEPDARALRRRPTEDPTFAWLERTLTQVDKQLNYKPSVARPDATAADTTVDETSAPARGTAAAFVAVPSRPPPAKSQPWHVDMATPPRSNSPSLSPRGGQHQTPPSSSPSLSPSPRRHGGGRGSPLVFAPPSGSNMPSLSLSPSPVKQGYRDGWWPAASPSSPGSSVRQLRFLSDTELMTSMAATKAALNTPGQLDFFDVRLPEALHEQFRADPAGLAAALAQEAYVRSAFDQQAMARAEQAIMREIT